MELSKGPVPCVARGVPMPFLDPAGVGDVTPQGWVRRHLKGESRDPREGCGGEPECARAAPV